MNILARLTTRCELFFINNYEIRLGKCVTTIRFGHWLCSWVYENNAKYFYFGLTLIGFSVTISKRKKKITGGLR